MGLVSEQGPGISGAPLLTRQSIIEEVRKQINRWNKGNKKNAAELKVVAIYGTGEEEEFQVGADGDTRLWRTIQVGCELQLRQALIEKSESNRGDVLLVSYSRRLPYDIRSRIAGFDLQVIDGTRRLATLFGASGVSVDLWQSTLRHALLKDGTVYDLDLAGKPVDLRTAWLAYFKRRLRVDFDFFSEPRVVAKLSQSVADEQVIKRFVEDHALCDEASKFIASTCGPIAQLCFSAWLKGKAADVAAMAYLLFDLGSRRDNEVVQTKLMHLAEKAAGEEQVEGFTDAHYTRWGNLAADLDLHLQDAQKFALIHQADIYCSKQFKQETLVGGCYLRATWDATVLSLAGAFEKAASNASEFGKITMRDFSTCNGLFQLLQQHHHKVKADHIVQRLHMTMRLLAYLLGAKDWEKQFADQAPREPVYQLAEFYASEGGFLDWARRSARGGDGGVLNTAIDKVIALADVVRDHMDARFAKGLVSYNADRKAGRVVPIEKSLNLFAVDFLKAHPHRKLLILLMDGMSWAVAAELLSDLSENSGVAPVRWSPKYRNSGSHLPAPMIAALPTITTVSRSAFFAGKLPKLGSKIDTANDRKYLYQHSAFTKLLGEGPKLVYRSESIDKAGHLSSTAREHILSNDRAVALVLNTMDDQLKVKPGLGISYNVKSVKALEPLLDLANDSDRTILLCADHGHILGERAEDVVSREGDPGGARWREITSDTLPEKAVVIEDNVAWRSDKHSKLALLYSENQFYTSNSAQGAHGGASLAEVVTPAILIVPEGVSHRAGTGDDEGLEQHEFPKPSWWFLNTVVEPARATKTSIPSQPKSTKHKTKVHTDQMAFPAVPEEPLANLVNDEVSPWAKILAEAFAKEVGTRRHGLKTKVIPVVELLVKHGGHTHAEFFAGQLGVSKRHVGGWVAEISEYLNADGYAVISYDPVSKQVTLNIALLEEQFGE